MTDTRLHIDKLVHDIIENHSKPNLEQRNVTWIHDKGHPEYIAAVWFESNGYLPNSSYPNPEGLKMKDGIDATPTVKHPLSHGPPPMCKRSK